MNQLPAMVEVFKTDIRKKKIASTLVKSLSVQFPDYKINIDMTDCDKILRIEGRHLCELDRIIEFVQQQNVRIEVLT
jgi:hypothetical protein